MADDPADLSRGPTSRVVLAAMALAATLAFVGFVALGTWQVHRMAWKRDLIARVEQRVHAPAVSAPAPGTSVGVADEYRHVRVQGVFLHDHETLVQANTTLGSGFWVLTPMRTTEGSVVFINRGFVPPEGRDPALRRTAPAEGLSQVTGLLRLPEPGGGFLRDNDPATGRWYSRDVAAMAAAEGLAQVVPYFVDASTSPASAPAVPVGGLTVITFADNHLVYAITWYALALMVAGATVHVGRREWRLRPRER